MNLTSRVLADIALRGAVLLGGQWVYQRVYESFVPGPADADIGEGLIWFGLVMVITAVWGVFDARSRGIPRLAWTWGGAGALVGLFVAVRLAFESGGFDGSSLVSDLLFLVPFLAAIVAVPALVTGAITFAVRDHGNRPGLRSGG